MYNLIIVVVVAIFLYAVFTGRIFEGFNDTQGKFCLDCHGKNFNSCLTCFNCGYAVDKNGQKGCIPGDHKGPYNKERLARWYYNDPWSYNVPKRSSRETCSQDNYPGVYLWSS